MRLHWNGCGLLLHEVCHLIHQLTLPDGLNNDVVKKAYGLAKVSGLYDTIRRRDWAGQLQDFDLAYAMVCIERETFVLVDALRGTGPLANLKLQMTAICIQVDWKEFFAEMSVSYWCQGYAELDEMDKNQIMLCSPPFMEPNVLNRLRKNGVTGEKTNNAGDRCNKEQQDSGTNCCLSWKRSFFSSKTKKNWPHCNKFYPFTRGQLKRHDHDTYQTIDSLWKDIAKWNDPWNNNNNGEEVEMGMCTRAPGCFWFCPSSWGGRIRRNACCWISPPVVPIEAFQQ